MEPIPAARNVVMRRARMEIRHRDGVLSDSIASEGYRVAFAECLAASVKREDWQRQTRSRGKDWRKGPATEDVSQETFLALEERWLVHHEHGVHEFVVKPL